MSDRATAPALTYVLAIGITTILVSGLLISASGFVDDRRERTVREELEIVGERLAASIAALDAASDSGGTVSRRIEVPATVLDAAYYVDVVDCGGNATCLELTAPDPSLDLTVTVPVRNRSAIDVERSRPRSVTITAAAGSDPPPSADADVSVAPDVGIADGVDPGFSTGGAVLGSQQSLVVPGFDYRPSPPAMNETITFTADVGGSGAGNLTYKWDFDGDGSYETTGNATVAETVTHTYANPGRKSVELSVEDAAGTNDSVTRSLRVSGLVFDGNKQVVDTDDADGDSTRATVRFDVRNNFADEDVTITDVLIDPEDAAIEELETSGREIEITNEAGNTGHYDTWGRLRIAEDGSIADLDDDVTLSDDESATVEMGKFRDGGGDQFDMTDQNVSVAFRYQIEGTKRNYVSEFDINAGDDGGDVGGGGDPPVIESAEPTTFIELIFGADTAMDLELSDPDGDLDTVEFEVVDDDGTTFYTETNDVSGGDLDREFLIGYDDEEGDADEVRVIVTDENGNSVSTTVGVSWWP
ncbi:PKD domain-containing protein [Haloplanus halophilus]|uniref:PKD domain-containing protein n=1 Tax=Haloplanus halophilus TaxID=2949993 RepID=UPI00203E9005|nr:PKD domain-containing protein [Haloplanus sp. GDY1]